MDDLISRQAAVKALEETKQSDPFNRYEYQNIGIDWSIDAIKALPSAQSEINYQMCANALLKMWMDDVLTDGEYERIMDKLNAWNRREGGQS